jgi:shikimate kinase
MSSEKVILIGPMGAGKTTLGTLISKTLGWRYHDNDNDLETLNKMTTEQLAALPVSELHKLEGEYLKDVMNRPAPFISGAAASVIDYPESVDLLKNATAVYLRIPLQKILERAGTSGIGRQALQEDAEFVATERFNRRDPLYRAVAKLTIDLGDSPENDAVRIINELGLQP